MPEDAIYGQNQTQRLKAQKALHFGSAAKVLIELYFEDFLEFDGLKRPRVYSLHFYLPYRRAGFSPPKTTWPPQQQQQLHRKGLPRSILLHG